MILALLLAAAVAQSDRSTDKLPPANPLPYADADEGAVMAPVNALFAALAARDGGAVLAVVDPAGGATSAGERPDGTHSVSRRSWSEFAATLKPGPERYEERLTDPVIEVDGDIAVVWGPYAFRVDGRVQHCQVDHFDLVRESGHWRILNATWSTRTTGC